MKKRIELHLIQLFISLYLFNFSALAQSDNSLSIYSIRNSYINHIKTEKFDSIRVEIVSIEFSRPINALMLIEEELLMLFKQDYSSLVDTIFMNETRFFSERNHRTFLIGYRFDNTKYINDELYFEDLLNKAFLSYLLHNKHVIKSKVENSHLSNEKKLFLYYYIDLMIYYSDRCSKQFERKVLDSGEELVKKYPTTTYADFARKYKRYTYSLSDWGWNAYIPGLTTEIPLKESMYNTIGPLFNIPFISAVGLGWNYKDFLLEAEGGYSWTPERSVLTSNEKDTSRFINAFRYSLVAGYRFNIGDHFTITPFVGRRHLAMLVKRKDHSFIEANPEYESPKFIHFNFSSRAWYYGLTLEFNSKPEYLYDCGERYSRMYHRLTVGLTSFDVPMGNAHVNGNMLVVQYAIGWQQQRRKGLARF